MLFFHREPNTCAWCYPRIVYMSQCKTSWRKINLFLFEILICSIKYYEHGLVHENSLLFTYMSLTPSGALQDGGERRVYDRQGIAVPHYPKACLTFRTVNFNGTCISQCFHNSQYRLFILFKMTNHIIFRQIIQN